MAYRSLVNGSRALFRTVNVWEKENNIQFIIFIISFKLVNVTIFFPKVFAMNEQTKIIICNILSCLQFFFGIPRHSMVFQNCCSWAKFGWKKYWNSIFEICQLGILIEARRKCKMFSFWFVLPNKSLQFYFLLKKENLYWTKFNFFFYFSHCSLFLYIKAII